MPKNFSEFLAMMDERLWFRMTVCFLPGLVVAKLAGNSVDGSVFNSASAAVLLVGVSVYVFWSRIRGLSALPEQEEVVDAAEAGDEVVVVDRSGVSAAEQIAMLAELRELCGELERESDRLVALEVAVNPRLTYEEATRQAITRRRIMKE